MSIGEASRARTARPGTGGRAKIAAIGSVGEFESQGARALEALEIIERGMRQFADVLQEIRRSLASIEQSAPDGTEFVKRRTRRGRVPTRRLNELIEERRRHFHPKVVRLLFVASPPDPSDPTSFYLANSHLFRCMRGAFAQAFGPSVPAGEEFLGYFRDSGALIVALPTVLRRGRGRPSGKTRSVETEFVARAMRETRATTVVAFRESLGQTVKTAAQSVGVPLDNVHVLRTPTDVLRDSFATTLRTALTASGDGEDRESLGLLRAVTDLLRSRANRPLRMNEIAAEVGAFTNSGTAPNTRLISALVRRHPEMFERTPSSGVRLTNSAKSDLPGTDGAGAAATRRARRRRAASTRSPR